MAVAGLVLVGLLAGVLAWRLHVQGRATRGPAGGTGEIEGTVVDLASRLSARLAAVPVKKGRMVRKGELVAAFDCADTAAALAEAEGKAASALAQAEVARAQARSARDGEQASRAVASAAEAQGAALGTQRDAARRQAARLEALGDDVAFSSRDQSRASADGLAAQVEAARAQAGAARRQALAAASAAAGAGGQVAAAEASLRAARGAAERARLLVAECELRAPLDAVVSELPHEPGELLGPGQVVARLVDLSEVKATFYLPNAELAAARPGGRAVVRADAFPGERFEGVIASVAAEAEFTPRNIQTRSDRDRLVYPIEVRLPNPGLKLRPGMPVEVSLPGTER
jgi:HlyD family secretion protein